MGSLRKLLIGLVLLGAVGGVAGSGTLASFNASTTNAGTFDTAFLQLTADKDAAGSSICYSTNNGSGNGVASGTFANNNNTTCTSSFSVNTQVPSNTPQEFKIKLTNTGDVAASAVKFYLPTACSSSNSGTVSGPVATDLCAGIKMTISQTDSSWVDTACVYGTASGNSCDLAASTTLLSTAPVGVANAAAFASSSLAANTGTKYYKVSFRFSSGASGAENNYMGKVASFVLTWLLEQ